MKSELLKYSLRSTGQGGGWGALRNSDIAGKIVWDLIV